MKSVITNERMDTSKVINVLDRTLWNCVTINFDYLKNWLLLTGSIEFNKKVQMASVSLTQS